MAKPWKQGPHHFEDTFSSILIALSGYNRCTRNCIHLRYTIRCFDVCVQLWNLDHNQDAIHHPPKFPRVPLSSFFLPGRHLSTTHSNLSISVKSSMVLSTKQLIRTYLLAYGWGVQNTWTLAMPVHHHPRSVLTQKLSFDEWSSPIGPEMIR